MRRAIAAVLLVGAVFEAAARFNCKFASVCREGRTAEHEVTAGAFATWKREAGRLRSAELR